jgi:hypothetical protein
MSEVSISYDPLTPGYFADPYPHYAQLREQNPVHQTRFGFWLVTRHTDVVTAYRHPQLSRNTRLWEHFETWRRGSTDGPLEQAMANWLVMIDPPRHTPLREIHQQAFSGQRLAAAGSEVGRLVAELLEPARAAGGCDLVADVAERLPVYLINQLLGLPRADWEPFVEWSKAIAQCSEAQLTTKVLQAGRAALEQLYGYFRPLIGQRRGAPGDDLLSALATGEAAGQRLTDQELLDSLVFLYQAGHPTSTHLVTLAVHSLLHHPAELARLRADRSLIPAAVEELQRFDGPVQMNDRVALVDLDLSGHKIRQGELVRLCLGSANRDSTFVADGDRLDLGRASTGQLGYGHGLHHCVGEALGRIQAQAALAGLLERAPGLRWGEGKVRYLPSTSNRGLRTLPVEF